jgi:ankyrin repeat protein
VAKLLVTQGADSKELVKDTEFGNSLQLGAYHGRTDIVKFLLSEDIPADKRVIDTELSKIVKFYHIYHATYLCSGGTYGTALQAASANGHKEVVQLLLDNRTDKEYINILGECFNVTGLGGKAKFSGRRALWDSTSSGLCKWARSCSTIAA